MHDRGRGGSWCGAVLEGLSQRQQLGEVRLLEFREAAVGCESLEVALGNDEDVGCISSSCVRGRVCQ